MNMSLQWLTDNGIEIFGTVTGILYVFLEVRQNRWLWLVGILTSAVYIWVFFKSKLYADMSLQGYYLVISIIGWYWWSRGQGTIPIPSPEGPGVGEEGMRHEAHGRRQMSIPVTSPEGPGVGNGTGHSVQGTGQNPGMKTGDKVAEANIRVMEVTNIKGDIALILFLVFVLLFAAIAVLLSEYTDSPVPLWDSFITSLSIVATWMLARKIYEHWYLWIIVNIVSAVLFASRGLYPTVVLYIVYCVMSFAGLKQWRKSIRATL